jgi:hypothetical protein
LEVLELWLYPGCFIISLLTFSGIKNDMIPSYNGLK